MRKSIFDFLFSYEKLTIYPEDMRTILGYQERIGRGQNPFIESSCGPSKKLLLHRAFSGTKETFFYETPHADRDLPPQKEKPL